MKTRASQIVVLVLVKPPLLVGVVCGWEQCVLSALSVWIFGCFLRNFFEMVFDFGGSFFTFECLLV